MLYSYDGGEQKQRFRMPTKILIADDHGVLRAGLRALLSGADNLQVIGEAADGEEALRLSVELRPDIVLMDVSMPVTGGIEATRRMKEIAPDVKVLILTVHEDKELLREAIRVGACGYINKRAAESELIDAIYAVQRGIIYVQPHLMRALVFPDSASPEEVKAGAMEELTPRELDVMRLIVQGHTNRQIADRLNLSIRTVETHRSNLMAKLNLSSRVELVRYAAEHGLLELGENNPSSV